MTRGRCGLGEADRVGSFFPSVAELLPCHKRCENDERTKKWKPLLPYGCPATDTPTRLHYLSSYPYSSGRNCGNCNATKS